MALVRSIVLSILLSAVASVAVRHLLSASHPGGGDNQPQSQGHSVVVVVPVFVGNSNNRIGYVKEVRAFPRRLFGRGGS